MDLKKERRLPSLTTQTWMILLPSFTLMASQLTTTPQHKKSWLRKRLLPFSTRREEICASKWYQSQCPCQRTALTICWFFSTRSQSMNTTWIIFVSNIPKQRNCKDLDLSDWLIEILLEYMQGTWEALSVIEWTFNEISRPLKLLVTNRSQRGGSKWFTKWTLRTSRCLNFMCSGAWEGLLISFILSSTSRE